MTHYEPYEPAEGDQSAETAGHAGFLAWLAARINKTVSERDRGYISPGELRHYPYELQSCSEHIVSLETALGELLRLAETATTVPPELHERIIRLLRTPEEWREWEKQEDAKYRREYRARMKKQLAAMTPEERKVHKARKELFKRMFNGKD